VELVEKNRKSQDSFESNNKIEEKVSIALPKKRQCYEKARCQITQAFESSEENLSE